MYKPLKGYSIISLTRLQNNELSWKIYSNIITKLGKWRSEYNKKYINNLEIPKVFVSDVVELLKVDILEVENNKSRTYPPQSHLEKFIQCEKIYYTIYERLDSWHRILCLVDMEEEIEKPTLTNVLDIINNSPIITQLV